MSPPQFAPDSLTHCSELRWMQIAAAPHGRGVSARAPGAASHGNLPPDAMHAAALRSSTGYLTRAARMLRLGLHLANGVYLAGMVYPHCASERQHAMIQRWSKRLLAILNIKLHCYDQPRALPAKCLLVANHVSWLDIFAISSVFPATFVAKAEVREWPFLGKLCERTGTIFIERGSSRGARRANREIAEALHRGIRPVVVYPEGTTTLGGELKPFRPALLQSAVDTAARIHPLALRYVDRQGERTEEAAWIGDASMLASIVAIVRQPEIALELRFLAAWSGGDHTRREIAARARTVISHALGLECEPVRAASQGAVRIHAARPGRHGRIAAPAL